MPEITDSREPLGQLSMPLWPEVLEAMRAEAIRQSLGADDEWLLHQVNVIERAINDHWYGWSEGCYVCRGHKHQCPHWDHAQSIALTWLMRRAGVL